MILATLLTLIFASMAYCTMLLCKRSITRNVIIFIYCVAVLLAWFPDISTVAAHLFGIGRGLDLVLTLLSVVLINAMLLILVHLHGQHRKLTLLARHIAIKEAAKLDAGDALCTFSSTGDTV
ncbi:DUF2304 domain-containing protein [Desulfovibrio sp. OttesenSCG-928-G15]|nr:DUF2304 domain-containing protein [Desulfovibrio sp. OttesenSCG-928-G15]